MTTQTGTTFTSIIDYHRRQYDMEYASTAKLLQLLEGMHGKKDGLSVLDIGCGGGANIHHLKKKFPTWHFTGFDIDSDAISLARDRNSDSEFGIYGIDDAVDWLAGKSFDIVLALQLATTPIRATTCIARYLPLVKQTFLSLDLYNEGPFENDLSRKDVRTGETHCYQIDSLETVKALAKQHSFECTAEPFEINIDLPKPPYGVSATYTELTADGRRIQISHPGILLPWYFVVLTRMPKDE
ncbi:MAG: class I SAM-dependent methyltransferase [Flavobacteriales bacterium]|nr:class I SAM-dependent methyltransferase [Flavobacteriales bacterium]